MQITLSDQATKDFESIPRSEKPKIYKKMQFLEKTGINYNTYKLQNSEFYRIRQGDFRIIFSLDEEKNKIVILAISHRKDAYS